MANVNDDIWVLYKFDEATTNGTEDELVDSSVLGSFGGKAKDAVDVTVPNGMFGNAFHPLASCARLRVPEALQNFTIAFWVKPTDDDLDGNYHNLIQKPNDLYIEFYSGGGIKVRVYGGTAETFGAGKFTSGEWAHVALSVSCVGLSFWINGELIATRSDTLLRENNDYIWSGNWNGGSAEKVHGDIDQLVIYKRPATKAFIKALYNNGNGVELTATPLGGFKEDDDYVYLDSGNFNDYHGLGNCLPSVEMEEMGDSVIYHVNKKLKLSGCTIVSDPAVEKVVITVPDTDSFLVEADATLILGTEYSVGRGVITRPSSGLYFTEVIESTQFKSYGTVKLFGTAIETGGQVVFKPGSLLETVDAAIVNIGPMSVANINRIKLEGGINLNGISFINYNNGVMIKHLPILMAKVICSDDVKFKLSDNAIVQLLSCSFYADTLNVSSPGKTLKLKLSTDSDVETSTPGNDINEVELVKEVPIKITVFDSRTKQPVESARVRLRADDVEIVNDLTDANGLYESTSYNYIGDQNIVGVVRKGYDSPYKPSELAGKLTAEGLYLVVYLKKDW